MFVGAEVDEGPELGVPLASITATGVVSVEADRTVARLLRHSHHPVTATIETRAIPNFSRARMRSVNQIHRDRQYSLSSDSPLNAGAARNIAWCGEQLRNSVPSHKNLKTLES